jgi:hypothetical protein
MQAIGEAVGGAIGSGIGLRASAQAIEYDAAPTVLVLGDTEEAREQARRAANAAGCRIVDSLGISEAAERLDRQVLIDATLLNLERDPGPELDAPLDALLERLNAAAEAGRNGSVVAAPFELVDRVAALTGHRNVIQLCEATEGDWAKAIARASSLENPRFQDISKRPGVPRLQQLSEEVGRIASILASLSEEEAAAAEADEGGSGGETVHAGLVRQIIRARRLRDQYLKGDLFADPAWDMLLDLLAAKLEDRRVAVSSLCIAAAVPPTTALRWIKILCDQGLILRVADPQDGRRVFIELAPDTSAMMERYLRAAQRISPLIV